MRTTSGRGKRFPEEADSRFGQSGLFAMLGNQEQPLSLRAQRQPITCL